MRNIMLNPFEFGPVRIQEMLFKDSSYLQLWQLKELPEL